MREAWGRRLRRSFTVFCALLAVIACNYPGVSVEPTGVTAQEIRQTLDAVTLLGTPENPVPLLTPFVLPSVPPISTLVESSTLPGPIGTPISNTERYQYFSQSGDTVPALAARFRVDPALLLSSSVLPEKGLIPAGIEIWIPNRVGEVNFTAPILPDSEVINSPAAAGFNLRNFIDQHGGFLSSYSEWSLGGQLTGAEIIERVSIESSINPRLLLALIELRAGWVRSPTVMGVDRKYPLGFHVSGWEGLYKELLIAATHLNAGYYGWRAGSMLRLDFRDGTSADLDPRLNAGTIAVQNMLARLYDQNQFFGAVYDDAGLSRIYQVLFGNPWERPLHEMQIFPENVPHLDLDLPFSPGERWSLTGGPHTSWKTGSPRGALDFAPVTGEVACAVSYTWVTAPSSGMVVRSDRNVVALDLDGDGREQTGWVLIFLHIADRDRVQAGTRLNPDDRIGHPSCEGGLSTGTHFHIARKFNGEWIGVDGPLPFILGGWQAVAGEKNYQGGLMKGDQQVVASPVGPRTSIIIR